jgi:thiamine biosynthesis lipoprotein
MFLLVLAAMVVFRCQPGLEEVKSTRLHMGTMVEITALGPDRDKLDEAVEAAFSEIERVERLMSGLREDSDVSRINKAAGGGPVAVDPEVFEVIARSLEISERSGGAFDITVAGLTGLWSMDPDNPRIAVEKEIAERMPLISWKKVILDRERRAVGLEKPGMRIDLGGIAKGYAVDRAIAALEDRGVAMALVNAGGDLRALGIHGKRHWRVGVQDPRNKGMIIGGIPVMGMAMATSGDYEKYIEVDGKRYCHILDPATGTPASACRSVTVITKTAWAADALATAVFVLGPKKGMALVDKTDGVEAVIIDRNGGIKESGGLGNRVDWLDRARQR